MKQSTQQPRDVHCHFVFVSISRERREESTFYYTHSSILTATVCHIRTIENHLENVYMKAHTTMMATQMTVKNAIRYDSRSQLPTTMQLML